MRFVNSCFVCVCVGKFGKCESWRGGVNAQFVLIRLSFGFCGGKCGGGSGWDYGVGCEFGRISGLL